MGRSSSLPWRRRWLFPALLVLGLLLGVRMVWAGVGTALGPPFDLDARPAHLRAGSAIGPPFELEFR